MRAKKGLGGVKRVLKRDYEEAKKRISEDVC